MKMSRALAEEFYSCHVGKPFFEKLINYVTSDRIVALILERDNAVSAYRKLIGATDPEIADMGTIRKICHR